MTRQLKNIHLFSRDGEYASFDKETYSLLSLNELTYQVIDFLQKDMSALEVSLNTGVPVGDIENLVSKLANPVSLPNIKETENKKPIINRITLHISNDCNLRCKYCYASGGNYKQKRGLMTEQTAKQFVDFCIETFERIENIVFFGGEPFLNPHIIKYVCSEFTKLYTEGKISHLPNFGAITNGTLWSQKTLTLIEKYFSFLTISVDGPKVINDLNRIDRIGQGSYLRISEFIRNVKALPNINLRYEATYTKQHVEMGFTHQSITEFFKTEFDLEGDVVNEHSLEQETIYEQTARNIEDSDNEYDITFWSVLSAIVEKKPKTMCSLYRNILAISVEGDIFPCHMNAGDKECSLGNIGGSNIYTDKLKFAKNHPGLSNKFKDNYICHNCWSNNICGGCSRLWFFDEEKHIYNIYPNAKLCQSNNRYLEEKLFQIIRLRKDPKKWQGFMGKLKKSKLHQ